MPKRSRSYEVGLAERLKDKEYASAYLRAAWDDSDEVFLVALRDVANAHGISAVAASAGVNRENLYRVLSGKGNPTFTTLRSVLRALEIPFGPTTAVAAVATGGGYATVEAGYAICKENCLTTQMVIDPSVYQTVQDIQDVPPPAWLAQKFLATEFCTE